MGTADSRKESFEQMIARLEREQQEHIDLIVDAFAASPAIHVTYKRGREELLILSGEMQYPEEGPLRVSYFLREGPRSHDVGKSVEELAKRIGQVTSVEPVSEDYVMEWMSTPEFIQGSKVVAFIQADNELRYLAGKVGMSNEAWDVASMARDLAETDIDAAVKLLRDAIEDVRHGQGA